MKELRNSWTDYLSVSTAQVLLVPLGLLTISLVTHILGTEGYAKLALFLSISHLIFQLGFNWTTPAIIRYGKEQFVQQKKLASFFFTRIILLMLCVAVIFPFLYFFRTPILHYISFSKDDFIYVVAMVLLLVLFNDGLLFLQALGKMRRYAATLLIDKSVYLLCLSILFFFTSLRYVTIVLVVLFLAKLSATIFSMCALKKEYFLPLEFNMGIFTTLLAYSWPLIMSNISGYMSDWIDLFIIKHYLTMNDVGIYQLAYQGLFFFATILMSFSVIIFPILVMIRTKHQEHVLHRYTQRIVPQFSFLWCMLLPFVILFSNRIFSVLFPAAFSRSAYVFILLLVCIAFQSVIVLYSPIFATFNLLKPSTVFIIIMTAVNIVGDLFLIPRIGIYGAAVATMVSYITSAFLYVLYIHRKYSFPMTTALVYPFAVLVIALFSFFTQSLMYRSMVMAAVLIPMFIFARRAGLYKRSDIASFRKVRLPKIVFAGIEWFFTWMDRGSKTEA